MINDLIKQRNNLREMLNDIDGKISEELKLDPNNNEEIINRVQDNFYNYIDNEVGFFVKNNNDLLESELKNFEHCIKNIERKCKSNKIYFSKKIGNFKFSYLPKEFDYEDNLREGIFKKAMDKIVNSGESEGLSEETLSELFDDQIYDIIYDHCGSGLHCRKDEWLILND